MLRATGSGADESEKEECESQSESESERDSWWVSVTKKRETGWRQPPARMHPSLTTYTRSLNFPASRGEARNAKCLRGAFCWLHRNLFKIA